MIKRKESSKTLILEVNFIVYITVYIIFMYIIVYFVSLGMNNGDIKMGLTKVYSQYKPNAINALANNTITKINNIISIFFTVIVASRCLFEILKFRGFKKLD